jgi:hypothetical protein
MRNMRAIMREPAAANAASHFGIRVSHPASDLEAAPWQA